MYFLIWSPTQTVKAWWNAEATDKPLLGISELRYWFFIYFDMKKQQIQEVVSLCFHWRRTLSSGHI